MRDEQDQIKSGKICEESWSKPINNGIVYNTVGF